MPYVMRKMHIALSSSFTQENSRSSIIEWHHIYDLVMDLLRNHFKRKHKLFCDNYYYNSSPQLFMNLWYLGKGATGTVRPYRKEIPNLIFI